MEIRQRTYFVDFNRDGDRQGRPGGVAGAAGAYVFPRSDFMNIANRHERELEELGDSLAKLAVGTGGPPLPARRQS